MHVMIQQERRPGHVSGVFENGDGQEQQQDVGQEHEHPADPADDAVNQQRAEQALGPRRPERAHRAPELPEQPFQSVHGRFADGEGQVEYQVHHAREDRQAQLRVQEDPVDAVAGPIAMAGRLADGFLARPGYKPGPPLRQERLGVVAVDAAQVLPDGLQVVGEVLLQAGRDPTDPSSGVDVFFQELEGVPAGVAAVAELLRDPRGKLADVGLDLAAVVGRVLVGNGALGIFGKRDGLSHGLGESLPAMAYRGHHGHAQQPREHLHVDLHLVGLGDVVHVQRHHHGHTQLQQLRGEVQVPLQVRGIDHVDHCVDLAGEHEVPRDDLFGRVGGQAVGARKVDHVDLPAVDAGAACLGFHGHAGVVGDLLPASGQAVEDGGLPGVGVARQGDLQVIGGRGQGVAEGALCGRIGSHVAGSWEGSSPSEPSATGVTSTRSIMPRPIISRTGPADTIAGALPPRPRRTTSTTMPTRRPMLWRRERMPRPPARRSIRTRSPSLTRERGMVSGWGSGLIWPGSGQSCVRVVPAGQHVARPARALLRSSSLGIGQTVRVPSSRYTGSGGSVSPGRRSCIGPAEGLVAGCPRGGQWADGPENSLK